MEDVDFKVKEDITVEESMAADMEEVDFKVKEDITVEGSMAADMEEADFKVKEDIMMEENTAVDMAEAGMVHQEATTSFRRPSTSSMSARTVRTRQSMKKKWSRLIRTCTAVADPAAEIPNRLEWVLLCRH